MPNFKPQRPNFYSRSRARIGAIGVTITNQDYYGTGLGGPAGSGFTPGTSVYDVGVGPTYFGPSQGYRSGIPQLDPGAISDPTYFSPSIGYRSSVGQLDPNTDYNPSFKSQPPSGNPNPGGPNGAINDAVKRAKAQPDNRAQGSIGYPNADRSNLDHPKTNNGPIGGSASDPTSSNFIPKGGVFDPGLSTNVPTNNKLSIDSPTDVDDHRVIIVDQTGLFVNNSTVFDSLKPTSGVLFPYPPTITVSHRANYESENLLHSNYTTPYYTHSAVDSISIQGRFTAQTENEAKYILSMMHFFRTVTKMFYAGKDNRGTPPPVLYLDAYGQYMFDHIPIVVKDFNYTLPNDVNYMTVTFMNKVCKVPLDLNITLDTMPLYSRNKISNNFDLQSFSKGSLLTTSSTGGTKTGGWI